MKKILIMYSSVGLGHKVVAHNIGLALEKRGLEVRQFDVLEFYPTDKLGIYSTAIYKKIIKYLPGLWGFFYTNRILQAITLPLRIPLAASKAPKLLKFIREFQPDLIVSSHPATTALASYLKKKKLYTRPLVVTFSDFHFQPFWVYPYVDRYLVMTEKQKQEVMKRGYHLAQIFVVGLPVNFAFSQRFDVPQVLEEFKLRPKLTVLVMGGSRGWGIKLADVEALCRSSLGFQIVVITGFGGEMARELEVLRKNHPALHVFTELSAEQVAKLFYISKILVTKAGGLSLAQAILMNLPMVLVNPLPTMEEMNEDYMLAAGAALKARSSGEVVTLVERLLTDRVLYEKQKAALTKICVPDAAVRAAQSIIDIL